MKHLIFGVVFVTLNCWAQRPPPPSDLPRAQKISITDYITSFQSYRDKNNKYIRVEGLIPEVCSDKVKLNYKCDEPTNTVTFIFKDATGEALSCLKKNQNLCTGQKHKDCVSLDKLARKSKDNSVINKVVFKKSESEDCSKIQVSTAKVAFQTKSKEVVQREEKTEAGVCFECMKTKEPHLAKLKAQAEDMKENVDAEDRPRPSAKMRFERERPELDESEEDSPRERPKQAMKPPSSSSGRPSMGGGGMMSGGMNGPSQSSSGSMTNMLSSVLSSLMMMSYSQQMNSYGASYGYPPQSGYMNYGNNQNYNYMNSNYMNSGYMNSGYNQNYNYMNYSSMYPYSSNQNYYSNSSYSPYSNYYANYNYGSSGYMPQYPYTGTSYNSYYNSTLPSLGTATSTVTNGR